MIFQGGGRSGPTVTPSGSAHDFISLSADGDSHSLLITYENSLDLEQARQHVRTDLGPDF